MPIAPRLTVRRSIDTETSGLDLYYRGSVGSPARPFFVTGFDERTQSNVFWTWEVDPLTRRVLVVKEDLLEIQAWINEADELILQNSKYDHAMLREAFRDCGLELQWDWSKVHDTLISAHLIASNQPKDLTTQSLKYINQNILPVETALRDVVQECRKIVQRKAYADLLGSWMIAKKGLVCMPSVKGDKDTKYWSSDMWLPRALILWCCRNLRFDILPPAHRMPTVGRVENCMVRIDRQTKWGNPFHIGKDSDRKTVIVKYLDYILKQPQLLAALPELYGQKLGCHCAPEACHGDILRWLCHPWLDLLPNYSNTDSTVTLFIHNKHMEIIRQRGYEEIYKERLKVLEVAARMEEVGIVLNQDRLNAQRGKYRGESAIAYKRLRKIAAGKGYDLDLPKSGRNKSLDHFLFGYDQFNCPTCGYENRVVRKVKETPSLPTLCPKCKTKAEKTNSGIQVPLLKKTTASNLALPVIKTSAKTGAPSADAKVLEHYEATLPPGEELDFVRILRGKRSRDTAVSYLDSYERFWAMDEQYLEEDGSPPTWYRLHPSFNPTATDTLRWNSKNPNGTNVSKKEKFNLRAVYGPGPGREWYSQDGKNLELRIAAYGAYEKVMIELFERPKDPPFYGSNHLLSFSIVYPDIWADALANRYWEWEGEHHGKKIGMELVGPYCKEKYADTWYQWCKNGNFAKQYGGQKKKVDATFHRAGAYDALDSRFTRIAAFNRKCIELARKQGYIETIPDKTVDPLHGYPLLCRGGRKRPGEGVSPTLPLNYWDSGSACWWIGKGMIRTGNFLKEYNRDKPPEQQGHLIIYVHDELVFDFPKSQVDPTTVKPGTIGYNRTNLPVISCLNALMAQGGDDIGIPTPVSCKLHPINWSEGFSVKLST